MLPAPQTSQEGLTLARATAENVPSIQSMVTNAYSKYTERIGKPPAPMLADYHELIKKSHLFILKNQSGATVGAIVLTAKPSEGTIQINNLVVDPAAQGRGYGRVLMDCAESVARSQNPKWGFVETGRRSEDGYDRVYFRKDLV